ncbi:MAG: bpX6 domain-containing protein, partial [Myxococcota bacterium]
MTLPRFRHWAHRGRIDAAGLWFADTDASAEQLLAAWHPGARIVRAGQGKAVVWSVARRLDGALGHSVPLVEISGVLSGLPLTDAERNELALEPGTLVVQWQGELHCVTPREQQLEAPAEWIDLSELQIEAAEPIDRVDPDPVLSAPPQTPTKSMEEITGAPEKSAEAQAVLAALRAKAADRERTSQTTRATGAGLAGPRPRAGGLLTRLAGWLFSGGASARGSGTTAAQERPARGGLFSRLEWALFLTPLGRFFQSKQMRFLGRMARMFERGDFENALRNALPLSNKAGEGLTRPTWGTPGARSQLDILPSGGDGAGYVLGEQWFDHLRRTYRSAFEAMDRKGEIDKAAFILAELLDEGEEAVRYLETHGRLRQAAEVADTKALRPALRVRQWWIAGDR